MATFQTLFIITCSSISSQGRKINACEGGVVVLRGAEARASRLGSLKENYVGFDCMWGTHIKGEAIATRALRN